MLGSCHAKDVFKIQNHHLYRRPKKVHRLKWKSSALGEWYHGVAFAVDVGMDGFEREVFVVYLWT